ncbi:hypothetical protein FRB96_006029 [Tulasnella sp. 330]|nr:hypothetical protein FRB96_006029 [Tulasnella sp. 330]
MTVIKTFGSLRTHRLAGRSDTLAVIGRDGCLSFIVIFIISVVEIVVAACNPIIATWFFPLIRSTIAILGSRLILNLRRQAPREQDIPPAPPFDPFPYRSNPVDGSVSTNGGIFLHTLPPRPPNQHSYMNASLVLTVPSFQSSSHSEDSSHAKPSESNGRIEFAPMEPP